MSVYNFGVYKEHRRTQASAVDDGIMKNYNKNNKIVSEKLLVFNFIPY